MHIEEREAAIIEKSEASIAVLVSQILERLSAAGTDKKRASAERVGIPMGQAFGVSVSVVRSMAKTYKGQTELAEPLWATGYHEAKLLAILLADPKSMTRTDLERWLDDVMSWDLCDHLCGDLVCRRNDALDLARHWIKSSRLYFRRAAFSIIAQRAVHDKVLGDEAIKEILNLIFDHADDARPHVRQAASWAIRSLGKRNSTCHRLSMNIAEKLQKSDRATEVWVGNDALRELRTLVSVSARTRLLSASSVSGRKAVSQKKARALRRTPRRPQKNGRSVSGPG